jgi:prepilin-type N-terminal cleavage/methylation domain-containing protein
MRNSKGFTLIELMIVVVIIGILAAIAIPNFIAMQNRAKEGSTKANMHTLQLAAEDYGVQNDGVYTANAEAAGSAGLGAALPTNFKNPFDGTTGADNAYEDRATFAAPSVNKSGMSSYADSATTQYNVKGWGKAGAISVVLTSGQ